MVDKACSQNPGPSKTKIIDTEMIFDGNTGDDGSANEGIIFMDLAVLFGIFNQVLKCPYFSNDITSHIDLKKHGFAHYTVVQCVECEWKYCFFT